MERGARNGIRLVLAVAAVVAIVALAGCGPAGGGDGGAAGPVAPPPGSNSGPAPAIETLSPASGPRDGGTEVTVTGSLFVGDVIVMVGGTPAFDVRVPDARHVVFRTPPSTATGAVEVLVRTRNGNVSAGAAFTYLEVPRVAGVEPASGPLAGGNALTITGTVFAGDLTVRIAGRPARIVESSSTRIVCTAPAGAAAGPVDVVVESAQRGASDPARLYSYNPAPAIAAVTPARAGSGGGTALTIDGSGFGGEVSVRVGGNAAANVRVNAAGTQVSCVTPAGTSGAADVEVASSTHGVAVAPGAFTYFTVLRVDSIAPAGGPLAGGTGVVILGAGLADASVTIGGQPGVGTASDPDGGRVVCRTPPRGSAGAVDVVVTVAGQEPLTIAGGFTYNPRPAIGSVTPASGTQSGGTPIAIVGTDFRGTLSVTVGGRSATGVTVNATFTRIDAVTPAGTAVGAVPVVVSSNTHGASAPATFSYVPPLTVTGVSPREGQTAGGQTVTITGSGFLDTVNVTFGSAAATSVTANVTGDALTCRTPANPAGAVNVQVSSSATGSGSLTAAYTYRAPPQIQAIVPPSGPVAGGTAIAIGGTGFFGTAAVTIDGVAATNVSVTGTTTVSATTPAGAGTGAKDVAVTMSVSGGVTATGGFTYNALPAVTSVTPDQGPVAGGNVIVIGGAGFGGSVNAQIAGVPCTGLSVTGGTTITCTVPASASGTGAKQLLIGSTANGTRTFPAAYSYRDPPTIQSIEPAEGGEGGGTPITIGGTGFFGTPSVTIAGRACTAVTVTVPTTITATTPSSISGTGARDLVVTMSASGTVTATGGFTYNPPPTLASVTPAEGPLAGGNVIVIEGTNYGGGVSALVDGVACTGLSVTGGTTITCTVPASQSGSGAKALTIGSTTNGTQTFSSAYTYRDPPAIASIDPASGPLGGQTVITIGGASFFGSASVAIAGVACTDVSVTGTTTVTATTPASASGTGAKDLVVTMSVSGPVTATGGFTYNPLPTLAAVTPAEGPVAGGNAIVIEGAGFGGAVNAQIDGVPCTGLSVTAGTTITCTVPASASGAGAKPLLIGSTANGTQTFPGAYAYRDPPTIGSIDPNQGGEAGGTPITIGGTNFFGTPAVTIAGVPCTDVAVTVPTTITARTPASVSGTGAKDVVVAMSASGTVTQTGGFTYNPPPTITDVTPTAGSSSGGTFVRLRGTNFEGTLNVSFGTAPAIVTNVSPTQIICRTDASAPGTVDVVVASSTHGGVTRTAAFEYLPPTANVSFAAGSQTSLILVPRDTVVGDLDGDGKPDVVAAASLSSSLSAFRNITPAGSSTVSLQLDSQPSGFGTVGRMALADCDADFKPDVVVARRSADDCQIEVNLNRSTPAGLSIGGGPGIVTGPDGDLIGAVDLNGDAKPDLIASGLTNNEIVVAVNTTVPGSFTCTFSPTISIAAAGGPRGGELGDFNLDGKVDVLTVLSTSAIDIRLNTTPTGDPTPSFSAPSTIALDDFAFVDIVRVADLNGDALPDLIVRESGRPFVDLYVNTTAPGAVTASFVRTDSLVMDFPIQSFDILDIRTADFNADGRVDIVLIRTPSGTDFVQVFRNETVTGTPTPTFAVPTVIEHPDQPVHVASGDLNLDGLPDLVLCNDTDATIDCRVNDSPTGTVTPTFGGRVDFGVAGPTFSAVADLNNDGRRDIATASQNPSPTSVALLRNTAPVGDLIPDFAPVLDVSTTVTPRGVALADVNGDGKADLLSVLVNVSPTFDTFAGVRLNTTDTGSTTVTFGPATNVTVSPVGANDLVTPDVDGDGRPDLAVVSFGEVNVLLNTTVAGALTPTYGATVTLAGASDSIVAADFNGDFKPDLATCGTSSDVLVMLNQTSPGDPVASFTAGDSFAATAAVRVHAAADVNRDGRPDLIVGDDLLGTVSVLINTTAQGAMTATFAAPADFPAPAQPFGACAADLTGDGAVDIAVTGTGGVVGVLRNTTAPGAAAPTFAPREDFGSGAETNTVRSADMNGDGKLDLITSNFSANSVSVRLNTR